MHLSDLVTRDTAEDSERTWGNGASVASRMLKGEVHECEDVG